MNGTYTIVIDDMILWYDFSKVISHIVWYAALQKVQHLVDMLLLPKLLILCQKIENPPYVKCSKFWKW